MDESLRTYLPDGGNEYVIANLQTAHRLLESGVTTTEDPHINRLLALGSTEVLRLLGFATQSKIQKDLARHREAGFYPNRVCKRSLD